MRDMSNNLLRTNKSSQKGLYMKPYNSSDDSVTIVSKFENLPKAKEACLVQLYGPDLGKRYSLGPRSMIIGRSESTDIYVERDSVSRNHARIYQVGEEYIIEDLGSTNGTYVNDQKVTKVLLRDGDIIKIGEVIFKFLSRDNLENVYHAELYRLATTDGLTTVYNKRYFIECIDREFSRAMRHNRSLSLVMMDIDHFKKLNDTYGHLAGDFVLKKTALLVKSNIRREDIFARYGGEEFALLLPETERWQAIKIAEKLRKIIERSPYKFNGTPIRVTASFGVASTYPGLVNPQQLIDIADKNLYTAKQNGRNQVQG